MKRALIALLGAGLLAAPGSAQTEQETNLIVFASDRTETLIPTEARAVDLGSGRSRRLGIVSPQPAHRVWAPNGRVLAFVDSLGDLYAVRPGHRPRRLARLLAQSDDHPLWSDSNRLIAFLRRDRGRLSVYVVRPNGRGLRRVAARIVHADDLRLRNRVLAWSPDDRRLAIVGSLRGRYRLFVARVRSGRLRRVVTGRGRPSDLDWSPDGRQIAFRAQVRGERAVVRAVDLASGRVRRVHAGYATPIWSPDGQRLALDEKHRLLVRGRRGSARLVATHMPIAVPPTWSPDSRRLVFISGHELVVAEAVRRRTRRLRRESAAYLVGAVGWHDSGRVVYVARKRDPGDLDIHVVRGDGTGVRALTANDFGEAGPAWSPDGRLIAFSRARDRTRADVYVMNADGTGQRRVVTDAASPSWSPDGRSLSFVRGGDIWTTAIDGSGTTQLTAGPETDAAPDWSPRGDEIAFSRDPDPGTSEIYGVAVETRALRRITSESAHNVGCFGHSAWRPEWSPDGRRLAYEVERGGSSTCSPSRGHDVSVHTIGADGAGRSFVTAGGYQDAIGDDGALTPTWSPEGTRVAFISSVRDRVPEYERRSRIGTVAANGGPFRLITPRSYKAYDPDWQP
jgi:Tol biopolymer transport system component